MNWREISEEEHRRMLEAARRKHPDTVAVLAFSVRFCKRPEWAKPVRWAPQRYLQQEQPSDRFRRE